MQNVPLFPLHTVLYPHGRLPLRIFEPRYVDMVSDCMKTGTGIWGLPDKTGGRNRSRSHLLQHRHLCGDN